MLAALKFGKHFTKVCIDMSGISGYRSLPDLISLLTMYATVLRHGAIVVKSGALKHFASHCIAWRSEQTEEQEREPEDAGPRGGLHQSSDGFPRPSRRSLAEEMMRIKKELEELGRPTGDRTVRFRRLSVRHVPSRCLTQGSV